jgi:membrane protein DedA with SNARE-associated domain
MHDLLTYLGIFAAVFAEGVIVLGTLVPGLSIVIAASFLASTGSVNVGLVFVSAWLGMFLSDYLGYFLGKMGLHKIPVADRLFKKGRPRVESFVKKYDALMVFYQFAGFARSPLPILLGAVNHPFKQWLKLLLTATTIFVSVLVGGSFLMGNLLGKDRAFKVVIIMQVIIVALFVIVIAKTMFSYHQRKRRA